jgi:hypothetical protein
VTKKQYPGRLRATGLAGEPQSMYHSNAYAQAVPEASVAVCVCLPLGRLICNETEVSQWPSAPNRLILSWRL